MPKQWFRYAAVGTVKIGGKIYLLDKKTVDLYNKAIGLAVAHGKRKAPDEILELRLEAAELFEEVLIADINKALRARSRKAESFVKPADMPSTTLGRSYAVRLQPLPTPKAMKRK